MIVYRIDAPTALSARTSSRRRPRRSGTASGASGASTASTRPRPRAALRVDTPPPTVSGSLHVGHVFSYTQTDVLARYQRMRGQQRLLPDGLGRQRAAHRAARAELLPRALRPERARTSRASRSSRPTTAARKEPPRRVSRAELHRAVPARSPRGREGLQGALAAARPLGRLDATSTRRSTTAAAASRSSSFLDLLREGPRLQRRGAHDVGRRLPDRGGAGRGRGPADARAPSTTSRSASRAAASVRDRDHAARAAARLRRRRPRTPTTRATAPLFGKRARHAALPRAGADLPERAGRPREGHRHPDGLHLRRRDRRAVVARAGAARCARSSGANGRLVPVDVRRARASRASTPAARQRAPTRELAGQDASRRRATGDRRAAARSGARSAGGGERAAARRAAADRARGEVLREGRPAARVRHHAPVVRAAARQEGRRCSRRATQIALAPRLHAACATATGPRTCSSTGASAASATSACRSRSGTRSTPTARRDYERPILAERERAAGRPDDGRAAGLSREAQRDQPGGFTRRGRRLRHLVHELAHAADRLAAGCSIPERHARLFPADLRPQSHEIIRTWAFYTIAKALLHEDTIPWRHVAISGWVLDPDRKKMSKSKGNVVTPHAAARPVRRRRRALLGARARGSAPTPPSTRRCFKVGKRLVTKLFNAGKFVLGAGRPRRADHARARPRVRRARCATLVDARDRGASTSSSTRRRSHETERFFWRDFTDTYLELVKARARTRARRGRRGSARRGAAPRALGAAAAASRRSCRTSPRRCGPGRFAAETGHAEHPPRAVAERGGAPVERAPTRGAAFDLACAFLDEVRRGKSAAGGTVGRQLATLRVAADASTVAALGPAWPICGRRRGPRASCSRPGRGSSPGRSRWSSWSWPRSRRAPRPDGPAPGPGGRGRLAGRAAATGGRVARDDRLHERPAEGAARAGSARVDRGAGGPQTAGRGRQGRAWLSPPGNLFLSVLLRPRRGARGAHPARGGRRGRRGGRGLRRSRRAQVAERRAGGGTQARGASWPRPRRARRASSGSCSASASTWRCDSAELPDATARERHARCAPKELARAVSRERGRGRGPGASGRLVSCPRARSPQRVSAAWRARAVPWWGGRSRCGPAGAARARHGARRGRQAARWCSSCEDGTRRRLVSGEVRELRPRSTDGKHAPAPHHRRRQHQHRPRRPRRRRAQGALAAHHAPRADRRRVRHPGAEPLRRLRASTPRRIDGRGAGQRRAAADARARRAVPPVPRPGAARGGAGREDGHADPLRAARRRGRRPHRQRRGRLRRLRRARDRGRLRHRHHLRRGHAQGRVHGRRDLPGGRASAPTRSSSARRGCRAWTCANPGRVDRPLHRRLHPVRPVLRLRGDGGGHHRAHPRGARASRRGWWRRAAWPRRWPPTSRRSRPWIPC